MSKLSKEKRDRLVLVGIGTAMLVGALYLLFISDQQSQIAAHANKIMNARDAVDKSERWLRMAPAVKTNLQEALKELDTRHEQMAPLDKFKWFYNTLEKFRAGYSINIEDITREPEIQEVGVLPKFPYQAASFGVRITGTYHEFGRFISDFENHFPYLRVQNIRMEMDPNARSSATNTVTTLTPDRERLAVTLRIVTLVKPLNPL